MTTFLARENEGKSRSWRGSITNWEYSPIEWHFGRALADLLDWTEDDRAPLIMPQVETRGASGKLYRLDFAAPLVMIAIELDGKQWHVDAAADNARQKDLEAVGWTFIRFTGKEIHRDADSAAMGVLRAVEAAIAERRKKELLAELQSTPILRPTKRVYADNRAKACAAGYAKATRLAEREHRQRKADAARAVKRAEREAFIAAKLAELEREIRLTPIYADALLKNLYYLRRQQ